VSSGNSEALCNLGALLADPEFGDSDGSEAVKLLMRAVRDDNNRHRDMAAFSLSSCYQTGRGVARDENEGMRWLQTSVDLGCPEAQNALGLCFAQGTSGKPQDFNKAAELFRAAASQGNHAAKQNLLSLKHHRGGAATARRAR